MRVMVIVKATKISEAGVLPTREMFSEMEKFNEELAKAGILQFGDGLQPSSKGKRLQFAGGKKHVVDGPFIEAKELVAGFWVWKVNSMEEAMEWANRCPHPMPGEDAELEIRPFYEREDFGDEFAPEFRELRERRERVRAEMERH